LIKCIELTFTQDLIPAIGTKRENQFQNLPVNNAHFATKYSRSVLIFIIQNSYIFPLFILAIFRAEICRNFV